MLGKEFFIYFFLGLITLLFAMNFLSIRMYKVSQEKKNKYRTIFNYFYGLFFLFVGFRRLYINEDNEDLIFGILHLLFGIIILILNYKDKLHPKSS